MGIAASNAYKNQFIKEKYDRVNLTLPKGMKAVLDQYQADHGYRSLNEFIQEAIKKAMQEGLTKEVDV